MGHFLSPEQSDEKRAARREAAHEAYHLAAHEAQQAGLKLVCHGDAHFQLRQPGGWIMDIYPGNRRIYRDQNRKSKGPFLHLPDDWTLVDVVRAAASCLREQARVRS